MDKLTAIVLRSLMMSDGWDSLKDLVTAEVFSSPDVRRVFTHIKNLHDESMKDISVDSLEMDIRATYLPHQEELRDELLAVVEHINEAPKLELGEVKRHVRRFVSRAKCYEAAKYIAERGHLEEFDPTHAAGLCSSAVDLWSVVDSKVSTFDNFSLPGETDDRPGCISMGISSELDSILGGGVAAGELAVIAAPPGRGKTSYLIAIGAAATAAGKSVLHITLEVNETKVIRRYQQAWSKLTKDQMIVNPGAVAKSMARVRDNGGWLMVKDWSYMQVRVDDIFALVNRLRQSGNRVDLVIIDYMELVKADKSMMRRDPRFGMGQVAQDTRAMAVALQVPVITAWQINRAGNDKHTITAVDLSECWDVFKHADIMFSLNQYDMQREERIMRVFIIKQRESTARTTVFLHSDLERCDIRDKPEEVTFDATDESSAIHTV